MEAAVKMAKDTEHTDVEERFRDALRDVLETVRKLAPHFQSVDDLADVLELALTSDGQLRLVMNKVLARKK